MAGVGTAVDYVVRIWLEERDKRMEIEKNNNKELVPLEHYLEEYAKADGHAV